MQHFLPKERPKTSSIGYSTRAILLVSTLIFTAAACVGIQRWCGTSPEPPKQNNRSATFTEATYREQLLGAVSKGLPESLSVTERTIITDFRQVYVDKTVKYVSELQSHAQADPRLLEMLRLLRNQGVESALEYHQQTKLKLLEEINAAKKAGRMIRLFLYPLWVAGQLTAITGNVVAARAGFREVLALDPDWPEFHQDYKFYLRMEASIALQLQRFEEAETLVEEALNCAPDFSVPEDKLHSSCLLLQSKVAYHLKDLNKAVRAGDVTHKK